MTKCLSITCVLLLLATAGVVASPESFYSDNLPSGVAFGMTPDQLSQARPEARKNDLTQSQNMGTESVAMVEIARQGNFVTAFWYRFKNGTLGAVSRSVSTKNLPAESAQESAAKTYNELRANFDLLRQEEVLRSTGASTFQLSAQLWEDKTKRLNIYFVATSQENTVIVFDPKSFGSTDFFVPISKRKEIDAQAKSVREMLGESVPTPPPIIDLLPTIVKESALTPTPTPETAPQTTPVPLVATPTQKQTPQPSTTAEETETKSSPSGFPIVPVAIVVVVIVGILFFILRRKST